MILKFIFLSLFSLSNARMAAPNVVFKGNIFAMDVILDKHFLKQLTPTGTGTLGDKRISKLYSFQTPILHGNKRKQGENEFASWSQKLLAMISVKLEEANSRTIDKERVEQFTMRDMDTMKRIWLVHVMQTGKNGCQSKKNRSNSKQFVM